MHPTFRYRKLAELATLQHGVVSSAQLAEMGMGTSSIEGHLGAGRMTRIYRGVYAVGHTALSERGLWMAAVLAAGPDAILSHVSAAQLHGMWRWRPPAHVHVLVPRDRRRVWISGQMVTGDSPYRAPRVRLRSRLNLVASEQTVCHGIPVRSALATIVDLASMLTVERLVSVMHTRAYQHPLNRYDISQILQMARGRPGAPIVREAVTSYLYGSAGSRSELEEGVLMSLREAGIAEPVLNTRVRVARGLGIEVDLHWPDAGLIVEIDGPGHERPTVRRTDRQRDTLLAASGFTVLRFTKSQIQRNGRGVIGEIRSKLGR